MSGRRERVTIIAHGATDGAPDVRVQGSLQSFQVNTRMTYDLGGKRMRQSDDKVEVVVYMLLDPDDARIFRDRNKPKPVQRLITSTDRAYRKTERVLQLLGMPITDVDVPTFVLLTGTLPYWRQLTARAASQCKHAHASIVLGIVREHYNGTQEIAERCVECREIIIEHYPF
jgi:hypothetical protein